MRRALELAERGRGLTSPNPLVGAVVAHNGEIVGEGFHEYAGGPHAEIVALEAAGARARGAILYVTLEPCNHAGRTPPCVPAIFAAGITRVVGAAADPNPFVPGGGAAALRDKGVAVVTRVLQAGAIAPNRGFFTARRARGGAAVGGCGRAPVPGPRRARRRRGRAGCAVRAGGSRRTRRGRRRGPRVVPRGGRGGSRDALHRAAAARRTDGAGGRRRRRARFEVGDPSGTADRARGWRRPA